MNQPLQPASPSEPAARAEMPDLAAIKQRQQTTWGSGDFAVVGVTLQIVGESLAEAIDIRAGERVIDIAAGNGNASLAAAHRFARVTSTDFVSALLDKGRMRAVAEGLNIDFREADAEDLPFPDASFDVALSTFGVMFTPDHERAAGEMLRVVRPGGRIGMANWTPDGFVGQLFKTVAAHVPPPPGLRSSALWGTEEHLRRLFGDGAAHIQAVRKMFNFRYASPAHWLQVFRDYYGPLHRAFAALDDDGQQGLAAAILALLERCNSAGQASLVVPAEYLEVVVSKRSI